MARSFTAGTHKLMVANAVHHQPELVGFAVSVWIKRTRTTNTEWIIASGNEAASSVGWVIFLGSGGSVNMRVSDGVSFARVTNATGLTDTTNWHNLLLVIDWNTNLLKGYLDGSATSFAGNPSDSISGFGTINPTASVFSGQTSAASNPFVGSIGPIAILKGRIPTSGEISDIAAGKPAHQVWNGYALAASYPLCGADLSEYASAYLDAPLVATGTNVVASPAQTWTIGSEASWDGDLFTGTDATNLSAHATTGGNAWAYHPGSGASTGTIEIRSNKISRPSASTSNPVATINASVPGRGVARIRADLILGSITSIGDQAITLIARIDPAANTFIGFQPDSSVSLWRSVQRVAGTTTTVDGEAYSQTATTHSVILDCNNTRYFLFKGTQLLASRRTETATLRDRPITPGFRFSGASAEASPAYWSADNLAVEYPFAIVSLANATPGSTTVGTYAGYHLPAVIRSRDYVLCFAEARYGSGGDDQVKDFVLYRAAIATPTSFGSAIAVRSDGSNYTAFISNPVPFVLGDGTTVVLVYLKYPTGTATFPTTQYFHPFANQGLTGNTGTIWTVTSTDQGATWGSPVEITSYIKNATEYGVYIGPGPGARITSGPYTGRILCGYGYNTEVGSGTGGAASGPAGCIFSDDGGVTWSRGAETGISGSHEGEETNMVVLRDGQTVVANCRSGATDMINRLFNYSTDGGQTWGGDITQPELRSASGSCFTGLTTAFAGTAYLAPNAVNQRERPTARWGDVNADTWSNENDSSQAGRISGGTMLEWSSAGYTSIMPHSAAGIDYLVCAYVGGNRTTGTGIRWQDRLTIAMVPRTWLGLGAFVQATYPASAQIGF